MKNKDESVEQDNGASKLNGRLEDAGHTMTEANAISLKVEINNLIWRHSPADVSLGEAERMACKIMDSILEGRVL